MLVHVGDKCLESGIGIQLTESTIKEAPTVQHPSWNLALLSSVLQKLHRRVNIAKRCVSQCLEYRRAG